MQVPLPKERPKVHSLGAEAIPGAHIQEQARASPVSHFLSECSAVAGQTARCQLSGSRQLCVRAYCVPTAVHACGVNVQPNFHTPRMKALALLAFPRQGDGGSGRPGDLSKGQS